MDVIEYLQDGATKKSIINLILNNISEYAKINTHEKEKSTVELLCNCLISECVHSNQYSAFTNSTIKRIKDIYVDLIDRIRMIGEKDAMSEIEKIVTAHRAKLIAELKRSKWTGGDQAQYAPCSEYSSEFQLQILRLDENEIIDPIIDIGCGERHQLVSYLKKLGYNDIVGLDQYASSDPSIICCNWLEYEFGKNRFGTILAHMSFTNHCTRHACANDRMQIQYERKYHGILKSLKDGGRFIYAPAVRSMESALDSNKFIVTYYGNAQDNNLDTVHIERISGLS